MDVFHMVEVSVNRNVKEPVPAERLAGALKVLLEEGRIEPGMYLYLEQFFELPEELVIRFLKESGIENWRELLAIAFEKGFRGNVFEKVLASPF